MNKTNQLIVLAKIGAPHGIKGEVRVSSYTQNPLDFGNYGSLVDRAGNTYTVTNVRLQKNIVVTRFAQIASRSDAERITNTELFVPRERLPNAPEDEFYIEDLVGMSVNNESGKTIGRIKSVQNFGAGDMLEITSKSSEKDQAQKNWFIEFSIESVPKVDLDNRVLIVSPRSEVSERDKD